MRIFIDHCVLLENCQIKNATDANLFTGTEEC